MLTSLYTRKLNPIQNNYAVRGRIFRDSKRTESFKGILRGQYVAIHTDNLNLGYKKCPSHRTVRWRMILEEFYSMVLHIAGKEKCIVEALSILQMTNNKLMNWNRIK